MVRFAAARPESAQEASLRTRALADLDRMAALGDGDLGADFARHGRAIASLWSPRAGGAEEACVLLAGVSAPQSRYVHGLALYQRGRFAESVA